MVNVMIGVATIWLVYLCVWTLMRNRAVALLAALTFSFNRFGSMYVSSTLYTEPLYAACALWPRSASCRDTQ